MLIEARKVKLDLSLGCGGVGNRWEQGRSDRSGGEGRKLTLRHWEIYIDFKNFEDLENLDSKNRKVFIKGKEAKLRKEKRK